MQKYLLKSHFLANIGNICPLQNGTKRIISPDSSKIFIADLLRNTSKLNSNCNQSERLMNV